MKIFSQKFICALLLISLGLILCTSYLTYYKVHQLLSENRTSLQTNAIIQITNETNLLLTDAESRVSYYAISNNEAAIKNLPQLIAQQQKNIITMNELTKNDQKQNARIKQLEKLTQQKLQLMYTIIEKIKANDRTTVLNLAGSQTRLQIKEQIAQLTAEIINIELQQLQKRNAEIHKHLKQSDVIFVIASLLNLLIVAVCFIVINYYFTQRIAAEEKKSETQRLLKESEERFVLSTEGSHVGLWDWKPMTDEAYFAPYMWKLLGYEASEMKNSAEEFRKLIHPDDYDKVMQAIDLHLKSHVPYQIEFRVKNKSGEYRWYESTGQAQWDEKGNPIRMSGAISDITERRNANRLLRESEAYKAAVLESALDSIITIDEKGTIISFNPQTIDTFGYYSSDLKQKNIDLLMPTLSEQLTLLPNKPFIEFFAKRKNGEFFPTELTISKMRLNKRTAFVIIVRDITQRKKYEKMKNEFISVVTHELRTPLTSIRGSLGLLLGGTMGSFNEKSLKLLEIANNNCRRLLLLINDILDIEKIEAGKMNFQFKTVNLTNLVTEAINANKMFGEKFGVEIELIPTKNNVNVNVDPDRLIQVLTNLISNAVKFSPVDSKVLLEITKLDEFVRVSVSDRGPGIPKEFHTRIFQKFSQADSSDTRHLGGTGLGLSISKAIIEKMNGTLNFISELNRGTTFYFELPLDNSTAQVLLPAANEFPTKKINVLICEDDEDQATYLKTLLESAHIEAEIAFSVTEAKACLAKKKYKAVILDLILPDQDGISFIRELRENESTRLVPIIVVSMIASTGKSLLSGEAFTIVDWLDKPLEFNKLLNAIQSIKDNHQDHFPKVLHVEDDIATQKMITELLKNQSEIISTTTIATAKTKILSTKFDLVILDLLLPDGNGIELLPLIAHKQIPVIILSSVELDREYAHYVNQALVKSKTTNEQLLKIILRSINEQTA